MVKNLPGMQETWVHSLGWEDPPEKGMATHCSILAWRIPWTEESGGLQPMESQKETNIFTFHSGITIRQHILNFFNFYLFLINLLMLLYNIVLVLSYIDLNPPWVYMYSPSWTPLPPPSPSHPSGSSHWVLTCCPFYYLSLQFTFTSNKWILYSSGFDFILYEGYLSA